MLVKALGLDDKIPATNPQSYKYILAYIYVRLVYKLSDWFKMRNDTNKGSKILWYKLPYRVGPSVA